MNRGTPVPITPDVLTWAISESGFSVEEIAERLDVPPPTLRAWQSGEEVPRLTQFRRLASVLRRPAATFLLPEAPLSSIPTVEFRHPVAAGSESRQHLSPEERRWLREAHRLQKAGSWLGKQLGRPAASIRRASLREDPETVAAAVRGDLQVAFDEQLGWKSVSEAQRSWRSRLEDAGILVFFIPLGQASCRGFSVWDERAPLIAVNTAWNPEARIFTLFHELGHLLTRTDSACIDTWRQVVPEKGGDPAERWCEQFAAAVLLPWSDLEDFLERQIGWKRGNTIRDLATVGRIARKLKTSLRATTLRLIAHQVVPWELYRAIPAAVDSKKGGGGRGRDRSEIRRGQYGERTIHLFKEAIEREILSRDDVLSYLDVPDADL